MGRLPRRAKEDGGEVGATGEGDIVAPDEPAELPSDCLSCIGRVDSAMARAGAATERAAGSLVYPHNADAGAEKDPKEKGTESSHSAAATEVKFEGTLKLARRSRRPAPRTMHPTSPRPCRLSFTGSDDLLLFSRLTQRLALSPAGDPLLFSRHVQKPAPRHLAGNLESSG